MSNKLVSAQFNITSNKNNRNFKGKNYDYIQDDIVNMNNSSLTAKKDNSSSNV